MLFNGEQFVAEQLIVYTFTIRIALDYGIGYAVIDKQCIVLIVIMS